MNKHSASKMADKPYVPRNIHHDTDTSSSEDSFVVDESEDEFNTTTYFNDDITEDDSVDESEGKESAEGGLIVLPMDMDLSSDVTIQYLIDRPMELDLNRLMETSKSHMVTCPVCFEISVLSKNSKLYDNIIAACKNGNLEK